ncbi:hypothetical protein [Minwuia sp.]|uniref:hypothetical protein n=1 Tax=Minwuia sp. TaxID=2493630 RepID=UPI003A8D9003
MRSAITLLTAAGFLAIGHAAQAEMLCKDRDEVLAQLSNSYKEAPVAMGLASNGAVLEVLTSSGQDATWTILVTRPDGVSCIMATGSAWQPVERIALTTDPIS